MTHTNRNNRIFTIKSVYLNRSRKRGMMSGRKIRDRALRFAHQEAHKAVRGESQYGACATWRNKIISHGHNRTFNNQFKGTCFEEGSAPLRRSFPRCSANHQRWLRQCFIRTS